MEEIWKDIVGYEGYYQVSNLGNIRSVDRYVKHNYGGNAFKKSKIIIQQQHRNGYMAVCLSKNNIRKIFLVHRLVCNAFIPNPNNYEQINHIDENKTNNNVLNLEWCSVQYNIDYSSALPILQFDKHNNFIKEYKSCRYASRETSINRSNIMYCLKGKRKTAGGYVWKYKYELGFLKK